MATGKINNEAEATRREPTSSEVNTLRPCLMRIKEVPQIRESIINKKMEVERGLSLIRCNACFRKFQGNALCAKVANQFNDSNLIHALLPASTQTAE